MYFISSLKVVYRMLPPFWELSGSEITFQVLPLEDFDGEVLDPCMHCVDVLLIIHVSAYRIRAQANPGPLFLKIEFADSLSIFLIVIYVVSCTRRMNFNLLLRRMIFI